MAAGMVWAFLEAQSLQLLCHFVIAFSPRLLGRPGTHVGAQGGCGRGRHVLIVLDMLLFADEFNNPVHFTVNSEGDQTAPAWAAPASAGRVTPACLGKDRGVELTAGTPIKTSGDLFLTSSRFGLVQNGSARLDWPAFASSVAKYEVPVLRLPASWSCWPKPDNPWDRGIVPAYLTLPCQQSRQRLVLGALTAIPFLIYFWVSWQKVDCLKLTVERLSCSEFWCSVVSVKSYSAFHEYSKFATTLAFRKGKNNYLEFALSSCLKNAVAKSLHRWTSAIPSC